ncbi:simple sugar transport system permease protein/ribose transport system permease protein [Brevibacillus aydinogluensis]|jgi:simple sugar transport system permease protein|uniref:ABC transporter permease n=1 Tax=Brevibacillus aydinogluensis TaxID=927786 RepID=A0AA48M8R1_9BACL|nr:MULTISPECIES: ABC transporter permease [Brevibacillus]MBR8659382.1 ABC transporter permease [Brevibacillus sp. NL20B1]MDT3414453.1 simple sugar transport system permease protein/ribose transport system permease protein [Brevibacillus aydinogluensis]CAJ1003328.1 ABC transporter permease [Brevibacillus aydinogluensis]
MNKILKSSEFGIGVILLLLSAALAATSPVFLTADNILDILKGNAVLGILAIGMTLVIITGGIDVSVAAVTAAITVIIGKLAVSLHDSGWSLAAIFLAAPLAGVLFGLVNGLLVAKTKIPPIVATLGTKSILAGATLYVTNGAYMNSSDLPEAFLRFAQWKPFGVSVLILIFFAVALFTWFLLNHTVIGRSVVAMGGNPVSAMRAGIHLQSVQLFVYAYMGCLAGIAAIVQTAYTKGVDPNGFNGFELTVIAAVVLGGANIMGGYGSIPGTILGVLLLGVMQNGLILAHVDTFWQDIVTGAIILIAVTYDVIKRKREEANRAKIEIEA